MNELFKFQIEKYNTTFYMDHTFVDDPRVIDYELRSKFNDRKRKIVCFTPRNTYHSENLFVENYGNPLCDLSKTYFMIVVESSERKTSFKIFEGSKSRRVGEVWFKTYKRITFLTFDKKTGDYYNGEITDYHKKKKKYLPRFRKNCHYCNPITQINNLIKNLLVKFDDHYSVEQIVSDSFRCFFDDIVKNDKNLNFSNKTYRDQSLLKIHLEHKKIKYPDNFNIFYSDYNLRIPRTVLKKNKFKLVDAFMTHFELNGKNVKKALHVTNNLNLSLLKFSYDLFGKEVINKDYDLVIQILNSNTIKNTYFSFIGEPSIKSMSIGEIKRVFQIFKNLYVPGKIEHYTFLDHFQIYKELKDLGELGVKWMSKNKEEFNEEHLDWSDKLDYYKKGTYLRIYPKFLFDSISEDISYEEELYQPKLLSTSQEYNTESYIQSNCVKTYIGRPGSIIVSVNRIDGDDEERATVEYFLTKHIITNEIICRRIQFLGKYNQRLNEKWSNVLLKLDERLLSSVKRDDFDTVKIKKICANGHEMFSDTYWNEEGYLKWTYKSIE